jgi:hypothetical protein
MIVRFLPSLTLAVVALVPLGAQGASGGFVLANASRGQMGGVTVAAPANDTHQPVDYQYAVRYSFLAGYEHSLGRVLSFMGAIGYQNALLTAYGATIPGYLQGDKTEVPFVDAEIARHWLNLPIDVKLTLPIGRGGLFLAMGPKASVLVSASHRDKLTQKTHDLGDETSRFNFAVGFRVGGEIPIGDVGSVLIESGYHKGLINTWKGSDTQEGEIVLLGIGFKMPLRQARPAEP